MQTRIERTSRLIEKGGIGLVMYQLARMGFEFTLTSENSDRGDIWVKFGQRAVAIEVKASTHSMWHLRDTQGAHVEFYCFVNIPNARCWILSRSEVLALGNDRRRGEGVYMLRAPDMPADALGNWGCLVPQTKKGAPRVARAGKPRVVRRRLATGEVKEYSYVRMIREKPSENATA